MSAATIHPLAEIEAVGDPPPFAGLPLGHRDRETRHQCVGTLQIVVLEQRLVDIRGDLVFERAVTDRGVEGLGRTRERLVTHLEVVVGFGVGVVRAGRERDEQRAGEGRPPHPSP